jgi:hypothetical protein
VLEHVAAVDGVEAAVGEGQLLADAFSVVDLEATLACILAGGLASCIRNGQG